MPQDSEPPEQLWTPQTTCGAFQWLRLEALYADPAPTPRPGLWWHAQPSDTRGCALCSVWPGPWSGPETRGRGGVVSRLPFLFKITRGHSQTRDGRNSNCFQDNVSTFTAPDYAALRCSHLIGFKWFSHLRPVLKIVRTPTAHCRHTSIHCASQNIHF